ncbi:PDT-domain-containing protein [Hortaea werneckii]|nr:PDT-domain-containing protein [Hortaea werneckii]KAI7701534.1 PDT-domain-containing protein [Hortaea werneckii]
MEAKKEVVGFLGPKASYTHQATLGHFPGPQYDVRPLTTIEDVFAAVQSGQATYGVVPFENSSNGSVVFTLDLFADLHGRYPDILVWDEIYLAVHHCLLGHIPATEPAAKTAKLQEDSKGKAEGEEENRPDATNTTTLPHLPPQQQQQPPPSQSGQVTPTQAVPQPATARIQPLHPLTHVKKLYSHPQAWGQCKNFLAAYLKGVERQDVSSTSKAAQLVGDDTTGTSAAISSRIAAELNGLDVLAQGIEDNEGNSTRFFVVRRQSSSPSSSADAVSGSITAAGAGQETAPADDQGGEAAEFKTLVSFTVDHGSPGALADCLEIFKKYGLNLTSINTRPSGEAAWHYIFFVEFMGRKLAEGQGGAVNEALQELDRVAKSWRWLGSWENALLEP